MLRSLRRILNLLINSLSYIRYRNPLVVSAYVEVRNGKVVHRNWGDDINVYLLEKVSGRKVVVKNQSLFHKIRKTPSYLCIGSTVGFMIEDGTTLWGAGAMYPYTKLPCLPCKIRLVRGPKTRKVLMDAGVDCPESYGDPALLVSRYYQPSVTKSHRLGIIAHYTDEDNPVLRSWLDKHPDILLIRMGHYEKWEDIPDMICSCEEIWSSSLHGLIVSDSYSVANRWVRFNGKVVGGDFKYQDYLLSVGRSDLSAISLQTEEQMDVLLATPALASSITIDFDGILATCPFIRHR